MHLVEHGAVVVEEWLIGAPSLHVLRGEIAVHIAKGDQVLLRAALFVGLLRDPAPEPMKAMLSLLLADFPGLPMAKEGNAELTAATVVLVRKDLRFMRWLRKRQMSGGIRLVGLRFIRLEDDEVTSPCCQ